MEWYTSDPKNAARTNDVGDELDLEVRGLFSSMVFELFESS